MSSLILLTAPVGLSKPPFLDPQIQFAALGMPFLSGQS